MTFPIEKTDAEWREILAAKGAEPAAFEVTRHGACIVDFGQNSEIIQRRGNV